MNFELAAELNALLTADKLAETTTEVRQTF